MRVPSFVRTPGGCGRSRRARETARGSVVPSSLASFRNPIPPPGAHQVRHALPYLVADAPDLGEGLPFRIGQRPVVARETWHVRTLVTTAHRDEQRAAARQRVGEPLRAIGA